MAGVLNTIKLSKHFQGAPKKEKILKQELLSHQLIVTKKKFFIVSYVKQVNKFVSYHQGQTPVFKKGFIYQISHSLN